MTDGSALHYQENSGVLKTYYEKKGIGNSFAKDNVYLESSFEGIRKLWLDNLNRIERVKHIMIAEAPLWGR